MTPAKRIIGTLILGLHLLPFPCLGESVYNIAEVSNSVILGARQQDTIGWNVTVAGDVNGDGLMDFLTSTLNTDDGVDLQYAYLILGSTQDSERVDLASNLTRVIRVPGANRTGSTGDFNGDGIDDMALADVIYSIPGIAFVGRVFIGFGERDLSGEIPLATPTLTGVTVIGHRSSESIGQDIGRAGDINADGFEDVMIHGFRNWSNNLDEVVFIYGGTDVPSLLSTGDLGEHGFIIESAVEKDRLGESLASVGDVNGDGLDDVLLGANAWGSNDDYAYLIFGATSFPPILNAGNLGGHGVRMMASGEDFAKTVCALGDINGDGLADFAVGEPGRDVGGKVNAGGVHLVFGRKTFPELLDGDRLGSYGITIVGTEAGQTLGQDLSGAADFDGDGFFDVATCPTNQRSEVYIIFGDERFQRPGVYSLDDLRWAIIRKPTAFPQTEFPETIEFLGDINGDGFPDLAIGDEFGDAYEDTPAMRFNSGLIHILFGGPDAFSTPTETPTITPTPQDTPTPTGTPTETATPTHQETGEFSGWILRGNGNVKVTPERE